VTAIVFDSSALLALLLQEPGADTVAAKLVSSQSTTKRQRECRRAKVG
jgi:PIN domain nuclease of toxin-antitoxin system